CLIFASVFVWSAIAPYDRLTWALEVAPAAIAAIILVTSRVGFPLTSLAYILILIHCIILMIGGHYTYAEVPLFNAIQDFFGSNRNNYDKIGHFAQGFIPAIITREIVIRHHVFNHVSWQNFFIICFCLAFSAFYELIEWITALLSGEAAQAFLGTQGYVWDTQSDMGYALLGAIISLLLLRRYHDQQLKAFLSRH
ncbi:UNVERIFIED_CONTAM: hypothetical protein GTU68_011833, partial [Idotea baltica]|nr:hypothetical protein [Idotea baltica]